MTCINPLLTQTGPMSIPVRALCKKVVLSVHPTGLDYSGVVLGEGHALSFLIKNDGALPSKYAVELKHATHPEEQPATSGRRRGSPS